MPNDEKGFDWEKIKTDPRLWMRLMTPIDKDGTLGRAFKDDENPFEKNSEAAMQKFQQLASEGKLYVREFGRASHFRKIEMDGDNPKLEGRYVQKLNGNTDPVQGLLMRASRAYFKWLGLDSIANWFDKRLKKRDERIERDKEYKAELKSLSKAEKKELKKIEKQEKLEAKAQKKLEKLEKELEKTRHDLDKLRGKDTGKEKGEVDSPLTTPPTTEKDKNTMQPTRLGDQPVREKQPTTRKEELTQERTISQEILSNKKQETKEKTETKETNRTKNTVAPDLKIIVNGVEYTKEDLNILPEDIRRAVDMITTFIAEQKALEDALKQQKAINNEQQPLTNRKEGKKEPWAIENAVQEEVLSGAKKEAAPWSVENTIQQEVLFNAEPEAKAEEVPQTNTEEPKVEELAQTAVEGDVNKGEISAPLDQPPKLEEEKVSMQKPPEKQETVPLQQRLAEEKNAMEAVKDWKNLVANALFSSEEAKSFMDTFKAIKDQANEGAEYLIGAVFGLLTKSTAGPESKQQGIDALLSGKPLGAEHQNAISQGISEFKNAASNAINGSKETLAELLADTIRGLSQQASRENGLSPRNVLIGRIMGSAAAISGEKNLELPLTEDDMVLARGAATLGDLALRHHNAKQYLAQEPIDMTSKMGRKSVRDLLAGTAIETMISDNHKEGQEITDTQLMMGQGMFEMDNLLTMISDTKTRRNIKPEQIKSLLEEPLGFKAARVAHHVTQDLLEGAMEVQEAVDKMMEKQMQNEQELDQPEVNQLHVPG